jgi:hypothetical protein
MGDQENGFRVYRLPTCTVCQCDLGEWPVDDDAESAQLCVTACGHVYHLHCMLQVVGAARRSRLDQGELSGPEEDCEFQCPQCRATMDADSVFRLFLDFEPAGSRDAQREQAFLEDNAQAVVQLRRDYAGDPEKLIKLCGFVMLRRKEEKAEAAQVHAQLRDQSERASRALAQAGKAAEDKLRAVQDKESKRRDQLCAELVAASSKLAGAEREAQRCCELARERDEALACAAEELARERELRVRAERTAARAQVAQDKLAWLDAPGEAAMPVASFGGLGATPLTEGRLRALMESDPDSAAEHVKEALAAKRVMEREYRRAKAGRAQLADERDALQADVVKLRAKLGRLKEGLPAPGWPHAPHALLRDADPRGEGALRKRPRAGASADAISAPPPTTSAVSQLAALGQLATQRAAPTPTQRAAPTPAAANSPHAAAPALLRPLPGSRLWAPADLLKKRTAADTPDNASFIREGVDALGQRRNHRVADG